MQCIDLFSVVIVISLIHFSIDYLSDTQIIKDETKIGLLQLFHHFVITIQMLSVFVGVFFTKSLVFMTISIITSLVIQSGYIINNDHCWLTILVNTCIDPEKPDRIWRNDILLQIKHYMRGNDWGYKNIVNFNQTNIVVFVNLMYIFWLIKKILK